MAASPSSVAATSDIEQPSSPAAQDGKSNASRAGSDDEDTQMADEPTEVHERPTRGRGRASQKGGDAPHQIGKIRHLKKEDGEPLWREDIQYDFLRAVFDNDRKVFTNSYKPGLEKQTFADLYIDTMSRSSKTSKVLRDKLLSDRDAAKGMAMVCLLVNVGRMNTTLNFFPEMRAQLRTYHAIPSLQAHQDAHAYKQLQDAPRLKSILKGGAEDRQEPNSLEKIKKGDVPRTNPVNLIFSMCQSAQKVAELHFPDHQEFHDLIMKTQYSSSSRALAFLWLMWFYLESDFTEEGCEENPFGAGVDYGLDVANQGVPELIEMTAEERAKENVDSPLEVEFGSEKQKTRAKILEMDQAYLNERETKRGKRAANNDDNSTILPRIRPSKQDSDRESTRSTPPPRAMGRGTGRRGLGLKYQIFEGSSPARHGSEGVSSRKPRPPTAHQLAVERNRNERVDYILDRGLRKQHHRSRKSRHREGAIYRAFIRTQAQDDPFEDSDGDDVVARNISSKDKTAIFREKGLGGLCLLVSEADDYGEEVSTYAAALRRSSRRLARWAGHESDLGVIAAIKNPKAKGKAKDQNNTGEELDDADKNGDVNGDITMGDADMEETALIDDGDDDGEDPDKTEVLGDSDVE
ncbi:hypothetical protein QQS21_003361 [Conoideocrella luteorostrata]|uniref:INO80 chromatin remodeling complex Ies1 n=1 Tax=Conoideocrella luteorostrata TaxID=1105319 RepID=A0AAJ0CTB6_9HYPO|nr:hypothetical protein QQS21_003361 [Conoideocrella luteorostrata]